MHSLLYSDLLSHLPMHFWVQCFFRRKGCAADVSLFFSSCKLHAQTNGHSADTTSGAVLKYLKFSRPASSLVLFQSFTVGTAEIRLSTLRKCFISHTKWQFFSLVFRQICLFSSDLQEPHFFLLPFQVKRTKLKRLIAVVDQVQYQMPTALPNFPLYSIKIGLCFSNF